MATYLQTIEKLQHSSLDALKQVQATQLALLTTLGELVTEVPAFKPSTAFENLPTFAELAELNASFTRAVLEQQKAYASQLTGLFTATQKTVVEAADRAVQTAASATAAAAK
jgi:hypothetical protein